MTMKAFLRNESVLDISNDIKSRNSSCSCWSSCNDIRRRRRRRRRSTRSRSRSLQSHTRKRYIYIHIYIYMIPVLGSSVTRIASRSVSQYNLFRHDSHEATQAVNCDEDRVPNTPDRCNCGHFPKQDDFDMRVLNKATVTRTAFPDGPDPCDSGTLWQLPRN